MLIALTVFAVAALAAPLLTRWLGTRVFYLLALVPVFALVHALANSAEVLAGGAVAESYSWVPQFGFALSVRLDVLSWVMCLVVLGAEMVYHGHTRTIPIMLVLALVAVFASMSVARYVSKQGGGKSTVPLRRNQRGKVGTR